MIEVTVENKMIDVVTPKMADTWLNQNKYEYQRTLRPRFVRQYAREITKGNFKPYTLIEFAYLDDQIFIMDGQHRLAAIVKSGIGIPLSIQHRHYKCYDDIAYDYARTDYGKTRTWGDIVPALFAAMGLEDELVLAKSDINALRSSFERLYRGFMNDGVKSDRPTLINKILDWQPYARTYFDITGNDSKKGSISLALRRVEMVAMGIATIRFSGPHLPEEKSATDFWHQVMFDDGIGMHDPRKLLRRILELSRVQSTPSQSRNYTGKDLLLLAAKAWEFYCNDIEVKRLVPPKNPNIVIPHTPFDNSLTINEYKENFEKSDWGEKWIDSF